MNTFSQPKVDRKCFRRSKSMSSLTDDTSIFKVDEKDLSLCEYQTWHSHNQTESESVSVCVDDYLVADTDSEVSVLHCVSEALDERRSVPRNLRYNRPGVSSLERKIDRLSDLFEEQCQLLATIKDSVQVSTNAVQSKSYVHDQMVAEVVNRSITERLKELSQSEFFAPPQPTSTTNSRAKSLLDAIEIKRVSVSSLDKHFNKELTAFLLSDELRERMVTATAASVRDVLRECLSHNMATLYLPVLKRETNRLLRHVTRTLDDAFAELEENSFKLSRNVYQASFDMRSPLDLLTVPEHIIFANSMRSTVEEILDTELKQWREKVFDLLVSELQPDYGEYSEASMETLDFPPHSPLSPPQPADSELSIIDQLMTTAEINKLIHDGDLNGSFERALSAADLSLVMVACRAADPTTLFTPTCRLKQSVLLSLAQQLATDMVHETQLKCRYLEETIISLNTSNPTTRAHLPLVVGEVRKHLMKFLVSYPKHIASRRITLIVMAADNLLKQCNY